MYYCASMQVVRHWFGHRLQHYDNAIFENDNPILWMFQVDVLNNNWGDLMNCRFSVDARATHAPVAVPRSGSGGPSAAASPSISAPGATAAAAAAAELLELQVDYWTAAVAGGRPPEPGEKVDKLTKKDSKSSLKATFRSVHVHRLPQQVAPPAGDQPLLTLVMVTKERKQKSRSFSGVVASQKRSAEIERGTRRLIVPIGMLRWFYL